MTIAANREQFPVETAIRVLGCSWRRTLFEKIDPAKLLDILLSRCLPKGRQLDLLSGDLSERKATVRAFCRSAAGL